MVVQRPVQPIGGRVVAVDWAVSKSRYLATGVPSFLSPGSSSVTNACTHARK